MVCPGVVTNVTNFGAFVDIGVHQDGLVHLSQLADRFVKEPKDVVSPGDRVTVRVLEVNVDKKQIALTMRSERAPQAVPQRGDRGTAPARDSRPWRDHAGGGGTLPAAVEGTFNIRSRRWRTDRSDSTPAVSLHDGCAVRETGQ